MTHQIRPIDGNALLKDVNCRINDLFAAGADAELLQCLDEETKRIKSAPTLDYAPVVHAHWVIGRDPDGYIFAVVCSHCNENYGTPTDRFCRNCGAKMDEEAKYCDQN